MHCVVCVWLRRKKSFTENHEFDTCLKYLIYVLTKGVLPVGFTPSTHCYNTQTPTKVFNSNSCALSWVLSKENRNCYNSLLPLLLVPLLLLRRLQGRARNSCFQTISCQHIALHVCFVVVLGCKRKFLSPISKISNRRQPLARGRITSDVITTAVISCKFHTMH